MLKLDSSASKWLAPIGYLYRWAVQLRNFAFDRGWLSSKSYAIPIICIGNVTVGGTGKTPHVELVLRWLTPRYRVAVLTRGYGRKTRGLVLATTTSTVAEIGDEPRQMKLKYPDVMIAIDGDRVRAMDYLMQLPEQERPEVVIMDDGFQHRYIRPSYSIVLLDANRPLKEERLLPVGSLREPLSALDRADCVIATKCPPDMLPIDLRIIKRNLNLFPHQRIYFSKVKYSQLVPLSVFSNKASGAVAFCSLEQKAPVVMLCGIANPEPLEQYIGEHFRLVDKLVYPDHYTFSKEDINNWLALSISIIEEIGVAPYFICTEKDAVRLSSLIHDIEPSLLERIYYQPIEVEIVDKAQDFIQLIDTLAQGGQPKGTTPRYEYSTNRNF